MTQRWKYLLLRSLENGSLIFLAIFAVFGTMSSRFLQVGNIMNILTQSSSIGIVAVGMTCTLLTAGVDLSVGATMFIAAAVAGKMVLAGTAIPLAVAAVIAVGIAMGLINAVLIAYLSIQPFIATLGTLFVGRGLALLITQTRAMNLPEGFVRLGAGRLLGIPFPILIFASVLLLVHFVLTQTSLGVQLYAVGSSLQTAQKAGTDTRLVLASAYVICGICAAIGGLVSMTLLGTVSQTFGYQREFAAISAAVLGGTSLFGGRGKVFPGTAIGALLMQTVEDGLVIVNADPYIYPLITGGVIFSTVLVDSLRHVQFSKLARRKIRPVGNI